MQAALLANGSVSKAEKATNLEAAKKIYENGDRNGAPYTNKPIEDFASYDTGALSQEAQAKASKESAKKGGGGFWGRSAAKK